MNDLRQTRVNLAGLTLVLLAIGSVMIYSASAVYALENLGEASYYLKRHLLYMLIGFGTAFFMMSFDYSRLRKMAKPLLLFSVVMLVLLFIAGREVGGARRWFRLGMVSFQPSEFAKFTVIVYLADYLSRKRQRVREFARGFFPALAVVGGVSLLILLQPDMGTTLVIFSVSFLMFFCSGVRLTHMLSVVISSLPLVYVLIFSVPYRRRRVLAFLNPWEDPQGAGFQIIQSLVALGSGGLLGVGLGQGKQKLFYLPAAYTDFIFSIIGEEMGFVGSAGVLIIFSLFLFFGLRIALAARDSFGRLLAFGLLSCLALEGIVNIGVVTSMLPTKGLPFPFISYGGTSLVFNMLYVGLILNIGKNE